MKTPLLVGLPVDLFQSLALHLQAARDQRSALRDESGRS